jgi:hypothetical protein
MRLRILIATSLLSIAVQADETQPLTPSEQTWFWMIILNSDSATEALARLREYGVSETGATSLLKYIEDGLAAVNINGTRRILRLCDRKAELTEREVLAHEFERQHAEEDAEQRSIVDGVAQILDPVDLRRFNASARSIRNASKHGFDLPTDIRAGRMAPKDIFTRACENADGLRDKVPNRSEPV